MSVPTSASYSPVLPIDLYSMVYLDIQSGRCRPTYSDWDLEASVSLKLSGKPSPLNKEGAVKAIQRTAAEALLSKLFSKCLDQEEPEAEARAIDLFKSMNTRCSTWNLTCTHPFSDELINGVKQTLYEFFYPHGEPLFNVSEIFSKMDVGPGAVLEKGAYQFGSDESNIRLPALDLAGKLLTRKLSFPHEYWTAIMNDMAKKTVSSSYTNCTPWREAISKSWERLGQFTTAYSCGLLTVPKKREIRRTITLEPLGTILIAKGIAAKLIERLDTFFGIKLESQQIVNRSLAQLGSISGEFSTLDLSSASDTISMKLLRELIPSNQFWWLNSARSQEVVLNKEEIELHMFAGMGNPITFPLQTAIFSSVVRSVYKLLGLPFKNGETFGVNGDDICVLNNAYRLVSYLLTSLGFLVNNEKSFSHSDGGMFRESCGGDYLYGHDIRPIYIKSLKTLAGHYVAFNSLAAWGARHGYTMANSLGLLLDCIPVRYVPMWAQPTEGIKVPSRLLPAHYFTKYGFKYRSLVPRKAQFEVGNSEDEQIYQDNPAAFLLGVLRGDFRGGLMSTRFPGTQQFVWVPSRSVNWDYYEPVNERFVHTPAGALEAQVVCGLAKSMLHPCG